MKQLEQSVELIVQKLYGLTVTADLTRTDQQFGDFATNIAMRLTKQVGQSPRDIANAVVQELLHTNLVASAEVAGPGFINITIASSALNSLVNTDQHIPQTLAGKVVIAEYSDPNPFKVLHAGHLYTSVVGDAIANVLQASGATVHRVNFGGDVGRHVGQTMWAIIQEFGGEYPEKLQDIPEQDRSQWMANAYIKGTAAYEDDESAKEAITKLNKQIYEIVASDDRTSPLAQIYWTCRTWSYDYFNEFYARIGVTFEKYYPESSVAGLGLATVKDQLKQGVFTESEGAVVFEGEKFGLRTRVFINKQGLPTYEAKDVGLILQKFADYHFDTSVVITGSEQLQYMSVVLKAVEQFRPDLVKATKHLTHGLVKLAGGVKMSSRKGNILRAVDVLDVAEQASITAGNKADQQVILGAVKYAFLKTRIGGDIIYDPAESVSMLGNSGPYLQYAHARAVSILGKSSIAAMPPKDNYEYASFERQLVLKISEFNSVIAKVLQECMPHHIATYLYELTQEFNRFYENEQVIGSPQEAERVHLLNLYAKTLKTGLGLLGIIAPEKM